MNPFVPHWIFFLFSLSDVCIQYIIIKRWVYFPFFDFSNKFCAIQWFQLLVWHNFSCNSLAKSISISSTNLWNFIKNLINYLSHTYWISNIFWISSIIKCFIMQYFIGSHSSRQMYKITISNTMLKMRFVIYRYTQKLTFL